MSVHIFSKRTDFEKLQENFAALAAEIAKADAAAGELGEKKTAIENKLNEDCCPDCSTRLPVVL